MAKRLFVDMDGTIARFYESEHCMEEMLEPGFFRNLKPYRRVVNALKDFKEKHPEVQMFILSACVTDVSAVEKDEWLDEYFPIDPKNRIFIKVGERKSDFAPGGIGADDYLIDDYTKMLTEWEAAGGNGIKIRNELNCANGTWKGNKICAFDLQNEIEEMLEKILEI